MKGKKQVRYVSVLLDRHHIITAEGALTESFYPGPTAMRMLPARQRREVEIAFPNLSDDWDNGYGPTACRVLSRAESERLVSRLLESSGRLGPVRAVSGAIIPLLAARQGTG